MINFLTSNAKKAADFKYFGFGVQEFPSEIAEIRSNNVEEVSLHKARDTMLNNIVVEDTALYIDRANFFGTDIKHLWEEIQHNSEYNNREASWKVCLCLKKDDKFYLSVGETIGVLKYPCAEEGYHFEKLLAVSKNGKDIHFSMLSEPEQVQLSPRYKALRKLSDAVRNDDFSNLISIPEAEVKNWMGEYQVEKEVLVSKKFHP